ncbi:MAG TPA: M1 family peptidase [Bacteroidetes bacterium]|nr:M1 family peptidase [Bacteroidota bacterium]
MRRIGGLALLLALAACRSGGGVEDAPDVPAPQPGVDVQRIEAVLSFDPETMTLVGRATLTIAHPDTVGRVWLGLSGAMEVGTVEVGRQPVAAEREGAALAVPVSGVTSVVTLAYRGVPDVGVYREETPSGLVVWTDGWPTRAAGWLPAVHHPSDPLVLDLTLEVPRRWDVVASGTPAGETVENDSRRARFVTSESAPTYTLAWAVADFAFTDQSGSVSIRHVTLAQDSASVAFLSRTPALLDTLAAFLGPLPYGRFATVEVPLVYAGMENAAAPFFQTELYDAPAALEEVVIHEAVHQWWGNDVTPADWRDLWLAEGPATYLTAETVRRLDGLEAFRQSLVQMALLDRRSAARRLVPARLADPEDALTATPYQKGGAVLHLLRLTLGDEVFFRALRQTLRTYDDRPLSTAAFQSELEEVSGRDLDAFFQRWVYGTGVPTLRTRWDRATGTLSWEIESGWGLERVGAELLVRQSGATDQYVPLDDGVASLPGDENPEVFPVGWLAEVR